MSCSSQSCIFWQIFILERCGFNVFIDFKGKKGEGGREVEILIGCLLHASSLGNEQPWAYTLTRNPMSDLLVHRTIHNTLSPLAGLFWRVVAFFYVILLDCLKVIKYSFEWRFLIFLRNKCIQNKNYFVKLLLILFRSEIQNWFLIFLPNLFHTAPTHSQ